MIDVVLCASGSDEVRIVHGVAHDHAGELRVVRRCADLAETLAVVSAGVGDVVLIDLEVRGMDREALSDMLRTAGAVVGLVHRAEGVPTATTLGLRHVVDATAPVAEVAAVLQAAASPDARAIEDWVQKRPDPHAPRGRLLAVWGAAGAPGRSTLAANIAHEAALAGVDTILVDADTYGPALAQILGVVDDAPGLVAACRASARDTLDAGTVASIVPALRPGLRFLSGIGVPARWPEVRPSSLEGVWEVLRRSAALVVVDAGSCLEEDEELSYDTMAPRRNAASTSAVAAADTVLAVTTADPVAITRLLREDERLRELEVTDLRVVVNRVAPPTPADRIRSLVLERMDVRAISTVPDDPATLRRACWDGTLLSEAGPRTPVRRAVRDLALSLLPEPVAVAEAPAR